VFFAILFLLVGALYLAGERVYSKGRIDRDRAVLERAPTARVLLIGSSHAKDVSLKLTDLQSVSVARGGMDLFELGYVLRSVKRAAPKLETVLIALSYFSFLFDNAAYFDHGVQTRIGRRIQTYTSYPRLAFLPGDAPQFLKGVLWPLLTKDHYQRMFQNAREALNTDETDEADEAEPEPAPHAEGPARPAVAHERRTNLQRHAQARCRSYARWSRVMQHHHPGLAADAKAYLLELVRELEAQHVRVVLFTPPFLQAYSDCFDVRSQRLMRADAQAVERLTHARYFDYSLDARFTNRPELYTDSDHLNALGETEFTRRFVEDLSRAGVPARFRPAPSSSP
jgi:hypothetical protein